MVPLGDDAFPGHVPGEEEGAEETLDDREQEQEDPDVDEGQLQEPPGAA
jgi:hypothetical protein